MNILGTHPNFATKNDDNFTPKLNGKLPIIVLYNDVKTARYLYRSLLDYVNLAATLLDTI